MQFFSLPNIEWCFIFRLGKYTFICKAYLKMTRGTWRSLFELRLFCKWQCGIFCYQPFLFMFWELFVVTWTWTLSFTMGVAIYYYLYALFKTETWNGVLFFGLFFIFGYNIILFFFLLKCWPMVIGQTKLFNFCCTCLGRLFSCIGNTTVCVFWQMSA